MAKPCQQSPKPERTRRQSSSSSLRLPRYRRAKTLANDAPRSLAGGSGRGGFGGIFKATDCNFETGHALVAGHRGHAAASHRMEERNQLRAQRLVMAERQIAHRIAAIRLEAEAFGHLTGQESAPYIFAAG